MSLYLNLYLAAFQCTPFLRDLFLHLIVSREMYVKKPGPQVLSDARPPGIQTVAESILGCCTLFREDWA